VVRACLSTTSIIGSDRSSPMVASRFQSLGMAVQSLLVTLLRGLLGLRVRLTMVVCCLPTVPLEP
jgi:hypothetical protein